MANFFVGQRVRIVAAESFKQFIGTETRVIALDQSAYSITKNIWRDGLLRVDLRVDEYPNVCICVMPEWVEPILPEGHTQSIYSFQELMDKCREGVTA